MPTGDQSTRNNVAVLNWGGAGLEKGMLQKNKNIVLHVNPEFRGQVGLET